MRHFSSKFGRGKEGTHLEVSALGSVGGGAGGGGLLPPVGGGGGSPLLPAADEPPGPSQSTVAATFNKGCSGRDRQVCRKLANAYLHTYRAMGVLSVRTQRAFLRGVHCQVDESRWG